MDRDEIQKRLDVLQADFFTHYKCLEVLYEKHYHTTPALRKFYKQFKEMDRLAVRAFCDMAEAILKEKIRGVMTAEAEEVTERLNAVLNLIGRQKGGEQ